MIKGGDITSTSIHPSLLFSVNERPQAGVVSPTNSVAFLSLPPSPTNIPTTQSNKPKIRDQPAAHVRGARRCDAARDHGAGSRAPRRDGRHDHRGAGRALLRTGQAEAAVPRAEAWQPFREGG